MTQRTKRTGQTSGGHAKVPTSSEPGLAHPRVLESMLSDLESLQTRGPSTSRRYGRGTPQPTSMNKLEAKIEKDLNEFLEGCWVRAVDASVDRITYYKEFGIIRSQAQPHAGGVDHLV